MSKIATLLVAWLLVSVSQAGTVIEFSTDADMDTLYIQGDRLSVVPRDGADRLIYERDKRFIIVDNRNREYMVMDRAAMEEMAQVANDAMRQVEAQLAALPPEQREQMRQMMGGMMQAMAGEQMKIDYRATGRRGKTELGHCEWHEILRDGKREGAVCLADAGEVGVPAADAELLSSMQGFIQSLLSKLPMVGRMVTDFDGFDADKIPLIFEDASGRESGRLLSVRKERLSGALFQPPADFRRKSMMPDR